MLTAMPAAIVSSIAGRPSFVAAIFTNRFGLVDGRQALGLLDRALGVVGEVRVDLERDPPSWAAVEVGRSTSQAALMSRVASARKISFGSLSVSSTSLSCSS